MIKVFLVEDEIVMRNGIKNNIPWEKEGLEFAGEASDGELAYPLIRKVQPDILITDIRMPFMDGLELSELVKKEFPRIKIIILSGYNEFEYAKLAVRLGVSDYILKPVNPQEFAQTIEKVTGELQKQYVENEQRLQQSSYMREYLLYTLFNGGSAEQVHTLAGNLAGENFWNHFHRIVFLEFDREFF